MQRNRKVIDVGIGARKADPMKNIKRLISLTGILISAWLIWYEPFYIVVEYAKAISIIISVIIYLFFVLGLSTFLLENRTQESIRIVIIVFSALGIFPGIYFTHSYLMKAKYSFLLREGITARGVVKDKKETYGSTAKNNFGYASYKLYVSFLTNEKMISKSWKQVTEKRFAAVNVGDSLNVVYLSSRTDIIDVIISKGDSAFYATKLRPNP
jgi:hypothetical protein